MHLLTVWSWTNDQISLSLSFLIRNMKRLDFTRGNSLLRWKWKRFHLFCLIKRFHIMTHLGPKLLLLSVFSFPTWSPWFLLFCSVFSTCWFSILGTHNSKGLVSWGWLLETGVVVAPGRWIPSTRSVHSKKITTSGWTVEGGFILLALVERPRHWNRSDLGLNPNSAIYCVIGNLNLFLT